MFDNYGFIRQHKAEDRGGERPLESSGQAIVQYLVDKVATLDQGRDILADQGDECGRDMSATHLACSGGHP